MREDIKSPEALTYKSIMDAVGDVDFGPRLQYLVDEFSSEMKFNESLSVQLGMGVIIEAIEDGRITVPEESKEEGFEEWFVNISIRSLTSYFESKKKTESEK